MKELRGLARLRKKFDLSGKEAAKRLGCKQPWLSKVENATKYPSKKDLPKWMKFYGVKSKKQFKAIWEECLGSGLPLWDAMGVHPVIQTVECESFFGAINMRTPEQVAMATKIIGVLEKVRTA